MKAKEEQLIELFKKHLNYSAVSRICGLPRNIVAYRINKFRKEGADLPPAVRHTEESKRRIAETNIRKYGEDYYKRIAKLTHQSWVANGRKPTGFAVNRELARIAGKKGGKRRKHDTKDTGLL